MFSDDFRGTNINSFNQLNNRNESGDDPLIEDIIYCDIHRKKTTQHEQKILAPTMSTSVSHI